MGNLSLPTNTKPEEISGYTPITEGRYHCLIVDVQSGMTKTGKPYDRVKLQILAGEQPGQEQKTLNQTLFYKEEHGQFVESDAHARWAWAAGLLQPGKNIDFSPEMLSGTQVIASVVKQKNSDYCEVDERGYAVWPVGHAQVAGVPLGTLAAPVDGDDFL